MTDHGAFSACRRFATFSIKQGYPGVITVVQDGHWQMHLAQKDVLAVFNAGQIVNPVVRGHIAHRTDCLVAFKSHLLA